MSKNHFRCFTSWLYRASTCTTVYTGLILEKSVKSDNANIMWDKVYSQLLTRRNEPVGHIQIIKLLSMFRNIHLVRLV